MRTGELYDLIRDSISTAIGGEATVAVAYSGGIDSSVIASIAVEMSEITCYTCATADAYDRTNAQKFAQQDGFPHRMIVLTETDLGRCIRKAASILDSKDPTKIAYTIPTMMVMDVCSENCVLAGHGADELFGGYAKYSRPEDPDPMMQRDIDKMRGEVRQLTNYAFSLRKRAGFPFASEKVELYARSLPLGKKVTHEGRKIALREMAKQMNLRSHDRPKKAAQYSSGTLRLMERLAKRENMTLTAWTSRILELEDDSV